MILSGKLNGFNHTKPFLSLCDSFHIANTARTLCMCVCIFGPRSGSTLSGSHKEMNLRLHKTSHLQVLLLLLLYPYFTSRVFFFKTPGENFVIFRKCIIAREIFPSFFPSRVPVAVSGRAEKREEKIMVL